MILATACRSHRAGSKESGQARQVEGMENSPGRAGPSDRAAAGVQGPQCLMGFPARKDRARLRVYRFTGLLWRKAKRERQEAAWPQARDQVAQTRRAAAGGENGIWG